jgi:DNA-binding transcriptional regulator YiaG
MSNVVKILNAEIARISKREAKSATQAIGKSNTWLRKTVADLKRRVFVLERESKRLTAVTRKYQAAQPQQPDKEEGKKARLTSKSIRGLRKKLRLSQADFGRLVDTTPHSVYLWEKKEGALSLRDKTKAAILSIRGLSGREAKEKLEELGKKLKKVRKTRS